MHVEKLPSGATRVKVSTGKKDANGRYIYKCFTDKDERKAIRAAAEYMDEHRADDISGTFSAAMADYIDSSRNRLSPATVGEYASRRRVIDEDFPEFSRLTVDKIGRRELQRLVNGLSGRGLKPKTLRNYVGFVSAVMNDAGYRSPVVKLPEPVAADLRVPEPCEVAWALKIAEGTSLEVPIILAAYGTLRDGEICGLMADDVHDTYIHVRRDIVSGDDGAWHIKESPKNAQSNRIVTLPEWAISRIRSAGTHKKHVRRAEALSAEFYRAGEVFVSPLLPKQLSINFSRFVDEYGFEHFTFHRLRAFAASELSALGVPEEYILARGGWKTDHVMKSRYRRTLQTKTDEINRRINQHYREKNITHGAPPDVVE